MLALALAAALPTVALAAEAPAAAPDAAPPATVSAASKPRKGKRNLLTLGPTVVPLGVNARYQRRLVPHVSAFVGAGLGRSSLTLEGEEVGLRRTRLEAGIDLHPLGKGVRRLYVGPRFNQRTWTATVQGESVELRATSWEALVGWRWVGERGLTAAVGVGAGHATPVATSSVTGDAELPLWSGWAPRGELNLGFAF